MKLIEHLNHLSIEQLTVMAHVCGSRIATNSRQALMHAIQRAHGGQELWSMLAPGEQNLLRTMLQLPGGLVPEMRLLALLMEDGLSGEQAGSSLIHLHGLGYLMPVEGENGPVWVIPDDLRDKLQAGPEAGSQPQLQGTLFWPEETYSRGPVLLHDLISLLTACRDGAFRLTRAGSINSRSVQQQREVSLAPVPDELAAQLGVSERWRQPLPLLVEFSRETGLIEQQRETMLLTGAVVHWMLRPDEDLAREFLHWVRKRYWPDSLRSDALLHTLLSAESDTGWYRRNEAEQSRKEHQPPSTDWSGWRGEMAWVLVNLGLLELARQGSEWGWRPTGLGNRCVGIHRQEGPTPENWWTVQANFEVVAYRGLPLAQRWHLDQMAEFCGGESALRHVITRKSVYRALQDRSTAEDIITFLETGNASPLPQNLRASIEQWGQTFGRLVFQRLIVLRCDDAQLAREIWHVPDCACYLQGQLGDRDLIVAEEHWQDLQHALEENGYLPRVDL